MINRRRLQLFTCILVSCFIYVIYCHDEENEANATDTEHTRAKRQLAMSQASFNQFVNNVNSPSYDARAEEGWWNLYPYGRWMLDDQLMGQPGRETQANLGAPFPYFGYRFNYTFVYPMGMVSFARPPFTQPPWDFPNPLWPEQRDHAFIAPFYADATFQWVGNYRISNPTGDQSFEEENPFLSGTGGGYGNPSPNQPPSGGGYGNPYGNPYQQLPAEQYPQGVNPFNPAQQGGNPYSQGQFNPVNQYGSPFGVQGGLGRKKRQMPSRFNQVGMVVDPWLLDNITRDIQTGYNGATGFRAQHAFIVTWERMAFGGAAKAVDVSSFNDVKQWQNTFQLVIATDQIRTWAIFNYARVNWTTSMEAGGLNGFGGKQAAMAGFNGGNSTGWYALPYSGHGRIWQLAFFSNVLESGRWIFRIDEQIIPAGCSNGSIGDIVVSPTYGPMQGGILVNVSGPCLRANDQIKVTFESWGVDCTRESRIRAQCIMPMFHRSGLVAVRMSRDGGQSFPYVGWFYVLQPEMAPAQISLKDDVNKLTNRWMEPYADSLTMTWEALNITWDYNARVDIQLWGYWEDASRSHFERIDTIVPGAAQSNTGLYTFNPRTLTRNPMYKDAWKKFHFGFVQVSLTDQNLNQQFGMHQTHGVLWSKPTPFPWYYLNQWQYEYGENWALDMCIEWFEYDGRRQNFVSELAEDIPCPCRLEQAMLDLGRYMPVFQCDMDGNQACPFNKGSQHCIQSVAASWQGASQQCCYDLQGNLMFSDDWEPTGDYLRFFNPGTPARAHAFGSYPYRLPPRIPYMSHYQLDLMPYRTCCNYAGHCEFYYWRRQTNGCQDYRPPAAGIAYGLGHFVTFDGTRYSFPGKGYFVLFMDEDPRHRTMVQVRMEQPDDTLWHSHVNATVITGVSIRENNSDVVHVYARKPMRRWRYRMDVYVNNVQVFFDLPHWKIQQFNGLSIRNPQRNMNHSEIIVMLDSGAGVRIREARGVLDVTVFAPPSFNSTCQTLGGNINDNSYGGQRCYVTLGLLGTFTGDKRDDLRTLDGQTITIANEIDTAQVMASVMQTVFTQFGMKWVVTGTNDRIGPLLFPEQFRAIYNPLLFAQEYYYPQFLADRVNINASLIFTLEEVKMACAGDLVCQYDYILTGRREIAADTLAQQNQFINEQKAGSKLLISCGPLLKKEGIIKTPPAANYLDGAVVTFACKPEFYLHGDETRYCINGTWSPGWWAWCRDRELEYALKWLTGLLTSFTIVFCCTCLFCCCWRRRVKLEKEGYLQAPGGPAPVKVLNVADSKKFRDAGPLPAKSGSPTQFRPLSTGDLPPPPPVPAFDNMADTYDEEPRRPGMESQF